jgi:hypothetical protein
MLGSDQVGSGPDNLIREVHRVRVVLGQSPSWVGSRIKNNVKIKT